MEITFRQLFKHARDEIADSDPGLLRWHLACRGTLTVTLSATVLLVIAHYLKLAITDVALGIVFCLPGTFVLRDRDNRNRLISLLALFLTAAFVTCVTSLACSKPSVGEVWFLFIIFVTCLLQSWHLRIASNGLIAVVIAYVCLYLRLPPAKIPEQLFALLVGAMAIWLVSIVLFPVNAVNTLQRAIRTVLRRTQAVISSTGWKEHWLPPLADRLMRLTDAALAAEDQLVVLDEHSSTEVRQRLFELERAVHRLLFLMECESNAAVPLAQEQLEAIRSEATGEISRAAIVLSAIAKHVAVDPQNVDKVPFTVGPLNWRNAVQVTLASLMAMVVGMAVSPERWFWAVIAAYVVFINTRTRGDAIHRGAHRLIGTLVGLFGGLVLSIATSDSGYYEVAGMLLAVFGMYYFAAVNYSIAIFFVTVMIGLVYGALGSPPEPVLILRLEESAVGIVAALLSASFVFPVLTRGHVKLSCVSALESLRDAIDAAVGISAAANVSSAMAFRKLDRHIAEFRMAVKPLQSSHSLLRRARADRPLTALLACSQAVRALVAAQEDADADMQVRIRQEAKAVNARIAMLIEHPDADASRVPSPIDFGSDANVGALRDLDLAIVMLSERLGFVLPE